MANTDRALIAWLSKIGGAIYWTDRSPKDKKWLPCAAWKVVRAVDCHALLQAILPYLIIKKSRAELAIKTLKQEFGL